MALLPPGFLDCVVAIGSDAEGSSDGPKWIGTGFLVGRPVTKEDETVGYNVFLVTNKHVLKNMTSFSVGFNPEKGGSIRIYHFSLVHEGTKIWTGHHRDDVDVAVALLQVKPLREDHRRFNYFRVDQGNLLSIEQMKEQGISEGDLIYILGYPMALVDPDWHYAIARSGSIARIGDALERRKPEFLLDANVFPGNSGGPVVLRPEMASIAGTPSIKAATVIGIVSRYLSYSDVAFSIQTQRPRVFFEENSGLAGAILSEFILETIEAHVERMKTESEHALVLSPEGNFMPI